MIIAVLLFHCILQVLLQMYLQLRNEQQGNTVVHFIETAPSVLREVPWLKVIEYGVCTII